MKIPRDVVTYTVNRDGSQLVRTGRVVGAGKEVRGLFVQLDARGGLTFVARATYGKWWWFLT